MLIYERYFDMVLTTNMDPLLEDAIANARMRRRDWLLLINGAMRLETMESLLSEREPRVKLLKLHGDLYHRTMAWTPTEMRSYLSGISQCLKIVLTGRDLLAVGHSLDDSAQIRKTAASVIAAGRALWYANVREPPEYLASRSTRFIGGDEGAFESLLPALADALSPEWSRISAETITPLQAEPVGPNPDDLAAAVVGVRFMERGGGPWGANCTGFLLADPRLIVSYGYTARSLFKPTNRVTILTRDGRPLETEVLGLIDTHPEGPWLLQAPPELRSLGLGLSAEPVSMGMKVLAIVATGERRGISAGTVASLHPGPLVIHPIGPVSGLVVMNLVTASGSGGAPVVDDAFQVRGLIVGGDHKTSSMMYPASSWANEVRAFARNKVD